MRAVSLILLAANVFAPAAAQARDCEALRIADAAYARAAHKEALAVAKAPDTRALPARAAKLFARIPTRLRFIGHEHLIARLEFEAIDTARHLVVNQRMALMREPAHEGWSERFARERAYRNVVEQERKLDALYLPAHDRYYAAKRALAREAEEFASRALAGAYADELGSLNYDRAFAFDDRRNELRLCVPPVRGYMLDNRYCAALKLESQQTIYGVHAFASYSVRTPVQSDQFNRFTFGSVDPAAAVASVAGKRALHDAILTDRLEGLPSDCRDGEPAPARTIVIESHVVKNVPPTKVLANASRPAKPVRHAGDAK